ncbi:hypothetical protein C8F04DRAFT_1313352 [Mycena alexandri]|uniref:Alpha-type protein kinase domain-containing protein n=1 Tax=Mycena alexandri TaxID=1745969 RepID=A0AAD6S5R4_9AGAR|nr:hypothetical protein C8F04DRAFT_1313352 [Mycena alexandri]
MAICNGCSLDFYDLPNETCYKCKELFGKSETEKVSIRKKGQCLCCSVVYGELQAALCASCCSKYANADSIPKQIFELEGANDQILNFQTRLPRVQNSSLKKTLSAAAQGASSTKKAAPGISKGVTILQEMQDAREQGKKVKFTVLVYKLTPKKGGVLSMVPVEAKWIPSVRAVEKIREDMPIYDALDHVTLRVQQYHASEFTMAAKIRRQMITFYASESATKYANIPDDILRSGTVSDFLAHFKNNGYISSAQYVAKQLELKVVVNEADLYPASDGDFTMPSAVISGSKSRSSSRASAKVSVTPTPTSRARPVRTSAWPRTLSFSRPCPMVEYKFRRYTVTETAEWVKIWAPAADAPFEVLFVAADWMEGASMSKAGETFHKTGFLGSGTSKNTIYARVGQEEYALGQAQDATLDHHSHLQMLRGELTNLHNGAMILKDFRELADECGVNLPPFKFNVDGAILGALEPFEGSGNNDVLPLTHFLATRFLPCGVVDTPIQKFTGNADCGAEPTDHLTATVHAFSHYVPIFTDNELVLCDLQGIFDRKNIMTLIDPQSHSSQRDATSRPFWDSGPQGIKTFLSHHLKVCHENDICNRLDLLEMRMEHTSGVIHPRSPTNSPERPKKKPKPHRAGFPEDETGPV